MLDFVATGGNSVSQTHPFLLVKAKELPLEDSLKSYCMIEASSLVPELLMMEMPCSRSSWNKDDYVRLL